MENLKNFISRLHGHLNGLNDERLSGISQLLQPGSWALSVNILKEIKQNIQDLAEKAPDLFLIVAAFYYAKFIQSIEIENLATEHNLIPLYLKTIKIMKGLCDQANLGEVDFDYFIKIIIDCIKEILLCYENIEKTFECLSILKSIEEDFAILDLAEKDKYECLDLGLQDYVEAEEDLSKSYTAIKTIKEWGYDLFLSEGSWIAKVRRRLEEENNETCDKNLIKNILILFNSFENEFYPEVKEEVIKYCQNFAIDSSEISDSPPPAYQDIISPNRPSFFSSEFSPIFENHLIYHRSQFKLKRPPLNQQRKQILLWKGLCLTNQMPICVKEYKGNDDHIINLYKNEANMSTILSNLKLPFFLKQYGQFDDGNSHYIVMELCKEDLKELISNNTHFSRSDLANFASLFIEGLYQLKNKAKIYHRDIKPDNIMINFDNEFKLIDFNISKVVEIDSIQAGTCKHTDTGTLLYCSPEKFKSMESQKKRKFSQEKNDVYSLGLVILEMYSHEIIVKYRNNEQDFQMRLEKQINQISQDGINWLSELLGNMLAYNPAGRLRFEKLFQMIEQKEEFKKDIAEYHNNKKVKRLG